MLFGRNDAGMGPANSLHALAYYNEYKEKFDLDLIKLNDNYWNHMHKGISRSWEKTAQLRTLKTILYMSIDLSE